MLAFASFFFMPPIYAKTTPYVKGIIPNIYAVVLPGCL